MTPRRSSSSRRWPTASLLFSRSCRTAARAAGLRALNLGFKACRFGVFGSGCRAVCKTEEVAGFFEITSALIG